MLDRHGGTVTTGLTPAASGRRFDAPGDVHPLGRACHVDEAEAPGRPLRPGPRTPGHWQPEPQDPDQGPVRDEIGDQTSVRAPIDRHGPRVVREQVGPPLDVVREGVHQVGRCSDPDRDLAVHRSLVRRQLEAFART